MTAKSTPEGKPAPPPLKRGAPPPNGQPKATFKRPPTAQSIQEQRAARLIAREAAFERVFGDEEFDGDAYELLRVAYRSPAFPTRVRLDCAEICIKYEKPALSSVAVSGGEKPVHVMHTIMGFLNGTGRGLPSQTVREAETPERPSGSAKSEKASEERSGGD